MFTEIDFSAQLSSKEYKNLIKKLDDLDSKCVKFKGAKDYISFSFDSDVGIGEIKYKKNDEIEDEKQVKIQFKKEIEESFSTHYLCGFSKATILSPKVTLEITQQSPLKHVFTFADGFGKLIFYLSPQIHEDDD